MISKDTVKKYATKYQTTDLNVAREYCQHLFLSNFYRQKGSEKILFKGGTALRIIYESPRCSEDLDFSGFKVSISTIEKLIEATLLEIEREGIEVEISESKKTSSGYLAIVLLRFYEHNITIQIEISLRKGNGVDGTVTLITSDLVPPYTLLQLPEDQLVVEKFEALFRREAPRDFFDLYFILRRHLSISDEYRKRHKLRDKTLEILKTQKTDFRGELKLLLPRSHHSIIKDFKTILEREIERYL